MDVRTLRETVVAFARVREWETFHDPKNLAMALAAEVGELNALLRWVRNEEVPSAIARPGTREALLHEIGDVAILLMLLCARLDVDLDQVVLEKMERNAEKYPVDEARGRADPPSVQ